MSCTNTILSGHGVSPTRTEKGWCVLTHAPKAGFSEKTSSLLPVGIRKSFTPFICLLVVQNSAAQLLTRTSKRSHIKPTSASHLGPPVCFRIRFTVLVLTRRGQHGQVPLHIIDLIQAHIPAPDMFHCDKDFG